VIFVFCLIVSFFMCFFIVVGERGFIVPLELI